MKEKKTEKNLSKAIRFSQEFSPDDRLSRLIGQGDGDELSLEELDHVAAAVQKPDYKRFLRELDKKK